MVRAYKFETTFYHARPILEKTIIKNYDKFEQRIEHRPRLKSLMQSPPGYSVIIIFQICLKCIQNNGLSINLDGFSTPVISFWLICTTRRWD